MRDSRESFERSVHREICTDHKLSRSQNCHIFSSHTTPVTPPVRKNEFYDRPKRDDREYCPYEKTLTISKEAVIIESGGEATQYKAFAKKNIIFETYERKFLTFSNIY